MLILILILIGLVSGWSIVTIHAPSIYTLNKIRTIDAFLSWINTAISVLIIIMAWQDRDINMMILMFSVLIIASVLQKIACRELYEAFINMLQSFQIGTFRTSDAKDEDDRQLGTLYVGSLTLEATLIDDKFLPPNLMLVVGLYVELDDWQQPRRVFVYDLRNKQHDEIIAMRQRKDD